MCGIVGVITKNNHAISKSLNILKKLEYRGYDSAGLAYFNKTTFDVIKSVGKINNLINKISSVLPDLNISNCALAHTRWATHGLVNEINTHPHLSDNFVLVQNGIIENFQLLKNELENDGYKFISQTDTEILVKLIDKYYLLNDCNLISTIKFIKSKIIGNYSAVFSQKNKMGLYGFCQNTPLVVGVNNLDGTFCITSDVNSLYDQNCDDFYFLKNNELVIIDENGIKFYDCESLNEINKLSINIDFNNNLQFDKNGYDTYMHKEIFEQPQLLIKNIHKYFHNNSFDFSNQKLDLHIFENVKYIRIIGCGSAYNSGLVGKYFLEQLANIKTEVVIASEFRYEKYIPVDNCLNILISQSGETADTIACLKILNDHKAKILSITNTKNSTIDNLTKNVIYTDCGSEFSVASTKAYTIQVFVLIIISIFLIKDYQKQIELMNQLQKALEESSQVLNHNNLNKYIDEIIKFKNIFFIGRQLNYYLSIEGALKLKEVSYLNVNAYPAGELKHGPISLIDENTLTIALISFNDDLVLKMISNINEIKTRNGQLLIIAPKELETQFDDQTFFINNDSENNQFSFFATIYLCQLLALKIATRLGNDVDNPKNLAKSVTVE